jgi:hypothetical protein
MTDLELGPFTYIRITDTESAKAKEMDRVRREFYRMHQDITANVPEGRYRSLALTALEEASLWAQRGLALGYTE